MIKEEYSATRVVKDDSGTHAKTSTYRLTDDGVIQKYDPYGVFINWDDVGSVDRDQDAIEVISSLEHGAKIEIKRD